MSDKAQKQTLVLIDFDGTITKKDSFLDFILFSNSILRFLIKAFQSLPILIALKIKLISTDKAKEKIFSTFYKGELETDLIEKGKLYCEKQLPQILRIEVLGVLQNHIAQNHTICVVTASAKFWIEPWCKKNNYNLICTKYEIQSQRITGNFSGKNCRGDEKVERIKHTYQLEMYKDVFCYGDTPDDLPMLELGSKKFYKTFL